MGFHISPEANGMGEVFPHALVFPYAFFTLLDKWLYAVFLDLILAVQPQLLLYLQLYRQAVGIPACFFSVPDSLSLYGILESYP